MKTTQSTLKILLLALFSMFFVACKTQKEAAQTETIIEEIEIVVDPIVLSAYELRMNGRADSAKIILEQYLIKDSTNAMAWFELTRTLDHLGLANPRKMIENHGAVLNAISKAVEYAPENAYYLSYKGGEQALSLYIDLMTGKADTNIKLLQIESTYLKVLELDPDYYEVKITLVEFFGSLPPNLGGDLQKALMYTEELEVEDAFSGALAREILLGENADYIEYWKSKTELQKSAEFYEALGSAYLNARDIDRAKEQFAKARDLNPKMNTLYLDEARFYLYQAMQDRSTLDSLYPLMEMGFVDYLNSTPTPNKPMQAWVYGNLAKLNYGLENKEKGEEMMKKANALDPYFSKASGVPSQAMFVAPDKIVKGHGYFFRPF